MTPEELLVLRERLRQEKAERQANIRQWRIDYFNNLKPFETVDDIPDIPVMDTPEEYEELIVKNLIRCGAIPKDQLEVGATYAGSCRNASEATWNGKDFDYRRYKWGMWQDDRINHFQDDDGYDVFVPIRKL